MSNLSKKLVSSVVKLTKNLQSIEAQDVSFYKTSVPGFSERLENASVQVMDQAQLLLKYIQKSSKSLALSNVAVEFDQVTDSYESVVDVLDALLEKTNIYLDDAKGRNKMVGQKSNLENVNSQPKSVLRPQLRFEDEVDNSMQPQIPKLKYKPNATRPIEVWQAEMQEKGLCHPYEYEIQNIVYPEALYEANTEIMFTELASTPFEYIQTLVQLEKMIQDLSSSTEIAVDLEHHDYRSYQGFTCLIQISTRSTDYILDALELRSNLHLLNEIFTNPEIVKVFHGADSDVQWLQKDFGVYIVNLFDTFHASHALEMPQHSLAYLLDYYCSVKTDKKYQLADWRKRPLSEEMLKYARTDTHFLLFIFDRMRNELISKDSATFNFIRVALSNSATTSLKIYEKPIYDSANGMGPGGWKNMLSRYGSALDLVQLSIFKALHQWRDEIARQQDESVRFVMPNHALFNLATRIPSDAAQVLSCCHPPTSIIRLHANDLAALISEAQKQGKQELEKRNLAVLENLKIPVQKLSNLQENTHLRFEAVEFTPKPTDFNVKVSLKQSQTSIFELESEPSLKEKASLIMAQLVLVAPTFTEEPITKVVEPVAKLAESVKEPKVVVVKEKGKRISEAQLDEMIARDVAVTPKFKKPKSIDDEFDFDTVKDSNSSPVVSFDPFSRMSSTVKSAKKPKKKSFGAKSMTFTK